MTRGRKRKRVCPYCGDAHDCATEVGADPDDPGKAVPTPGAISVCISCGEWSLFDAALALRRPTPAESFAVQMSDAAETLNRARELIRRRGRIRGARAKKGGAS